MRLAFLSLAAVLAAVMPAPARAESGREWVFTVVDAVGFAHERSLVSEAKLIVTGVLRGESKPFKLAIELPTAAANQTDPIAGCERLALRAIESPGRFQFVVAVEGWKTTCTLVRSGDSAGAPVAAPRP